MPGAAQQLDLLNTQLAATQQQLAHITSKYNELAQGHVILLNQVFELQKLTKNHNKAMHQVMGYLNGVDSQRRGSMGMGAQFSNPSGPGMNAMLNAEDDHPSTPLQQAAKLLEEVSVENLPNKQLEDMTHDYHLHSDFATPPNEPSGGLPPLSAGVGHIGSYGGADLDNMVYPVGQTNGIDPINSEHIKNIPYSLPSNAMMPTQPMSDMVPVQPPSMPRRKTDSVDNVWGMNKPRILLVEDDKVCARIGCKFLQTFECNVETAVSLSVVRFGIETNISSAMDLRQ